MRSVRLVVLSIWLGLSSSVIEVAILSARKPWLKEHLLLSAHFAWMVPVVTVTLLALAGLGLALLARVSRWARSERIAIFVLASLAFWGPVLAIGRLHYVAATLLAVGLAVQTARLATARLDRHYPLIRSTIPWLAVLVIGVGAGVPSWHALVNRTAAADVPAARPGSPNVLLIVLDTVRALSLSLYGNPRPATLHLERLARDSAVFRQAFATSSWTLPSHASMFTGRWPHELSGDWETPLDDRYPTLAEVLRAHGYATAGFVANLIYCSYVHGLDRGFTDYRDFPISPGQIVLSSSVGRLVATSETLRYLLDYQGVLNRKTAADVNQDFLRWLAHTDRRPFFAFLNYMDAHEPYLPPSPFDERFGSKRRRARYAHTGVDATRLAKWTMSPPEVQGELDAYEGAIAYIDDQLGRLVAELGSRGLLDNTVLIVTSDHGEQLGEHGLFSHGNSLYRQVLEVPLVLYFRDRVPPGRLIHTPVTLRDIPATVMDLVGLEGRASFPGRSLARHWRASVGEERSREGMVLSEARRLIRKTRPWYPLSKGDMQSLVGAGYHYIVNADGREEALRSRERSGRGARSGRVADRTARNRAIQDRPRKPRRRSSTHG